MQSQSQPPMARIEALFEELVEHYGEGDDKELRVAAKMLMVALDRFRQHGGYGWPGLVREYLSIAIDDADRFDLMLNANRSGKSPLQ